MIRSFCCTSKTAGLLLVAWFMTGSALAMICLTAQVADAQPVKQEAAERLNRLVRTAMAKGDYKEAIALGHELVDLLPDSNVHPYNLSCAYALLGDKDNSVRWLGRAADKGFLFTATTMRDADLDGIRSHPGYAGALAMIQRNNAVRLDELKPMIDGAPLITHLPPGYDPTKPAPLIVALHPYGGRAKPIADIWKPIAADIGAIVVAPQAHTPLGQGFNWGIMEHAEYTIRKAIDRAQTSHNVDGDKIVLTGFSQGSTLAFYVALNHPEQFAGVIPVAGYHDIVLNPIPSKTPQAFPRFFIMNGALDEEARNNRRVASALAAAGAKVAVRIYDGVGHAFPNNRDSELREAIRFVLP